jgi:hypothetical protein
LGYFRRVFAARYQRYKGDIRRKQEWVTSLAMDMPWRAPRPAIGEAQMLKLIVAATLVVVITSSSAIAGIVLAHAALARTSTMNAGAVADEAQSFRLVAKAPLTFDW